MRSSVVATLLSIGLLATGVSAQEPPWDPANVKPCDRACLVATIDRYVEAMIKQDRSGLLEPDLRITENTATIGIGEGILWRARLEPTALQSAH